MPIHITTTSLITGSTNTDGTGSAENLTVDNGYDIDLSQEYTTFTDFGNGEGQWTIVDGDTTLADKYNRYGDHHSSITNTGDWNGDGQKEISIDTADFEYLDNTNNDFLTIENFVDVNLHLSDFDHNGELQITILDAKRGTIDLSDHTGNTQLHIGVHSNNANWSNMFEVIGSASGDDVSIGGRGVSQYTEFSMDLAGGDDSFSCTLDAAKSADQTRFVDGGEGVDTIYIYNTESGIDTMADVVDFVNFEIINARYTDNLTLTEEVLEKNGTEESPLIVLEATEIDFAGDVESISAVETDYINEDGYYEVTVDYADASYTVITDSVDDSWLAQATSIK